jgi:hypothetical protein
MNKRDTIDDLKENICQEIGAISVDMLLSYIYTFVGTMSSYAWVKGRGGDVQFQHCL